APAKIGPDQPEVLPHRIALDPHLAGKPSVLGGLLDTLAGLIILPAMVEAADAVPLDPPGRELRPPVRAAEVHQVRLSSLAPVQRVVLTHDAQRLCIPGRQRAPDVDRMPEGAQEAPRRRARARVREVTRVYPRATFLGRCAAARHAEPPRFC